MPCSSLTRDKVLENDDMTSSSKTIGDVKTKINFFCMVCTFRIAYEHSRLFVFGFISSFNECIRSSVWRNHKSIVLLQRVLLMVMSLEKRLRKEI